MRAVVERAGGRYRAGLLRPVALVVLAGLLCALAGCVVYPHQDDDDDRGYGYSPYPPPAYGYPPMGYGWGDREGDDD